MQDVKTRIQLRKNGANPSVNVSTPALFALRSKKGWGTNGAPYSPKHGGSESVAQSPSHLLGNLSAVLLRSRALRSCKRLVDPHQHSHTNQELRRLNCKELAL